MKNSIPVLLCFLILILPFSNIIGQNNFLLKPDHVDILQNPKEILVTHNVYHWLKDRVVIASEWDMMFHNQFVPEVDPANDKCWLVLMEEFGCDGSLSSSPS